MQRVIVIGGGPAGMMAAAAAAENGGRVTLLEKKEKPGKKLKLTGKGRCNITSARERENFISGYAGNGRFLYSALNEFSNRDVIAFFNRQGLATVVERGQRVFPASNRAEDVVAVLYKNMLDHGVEVICSSRVEGIKIADARVVGIKMEKVLMPCQAAIIATGGMSYPLDRRRVCLGPGRRASFGGTASGIGTAGGQRGMGEAAPGLESQKCQGARLPVKWRQD